MTVFQGTAMLSFSQWLYCVSGPKLFVKPSSKSNRHIIINALSYCCLAGIVNNDLKSKVLEVRSRTLALKVKVIDVMMTCFTCISTGRVTFMRRMEF
jgi:hypothetical protein